MTSSKKETFLPLYFSLSMGSLGDFSRLLRPTRLPTSVSVITITLLELSSSCSSSSSSGSLPGERPLLPRPSRLLRPPSPNPPFPEGRVRVRGGRARERRASFAVREKKNSWHLQLKYRKICTSAGTLTFSFIYNNNNHTNENPNGNVT